MPTNRNHRNDPDDITGGRQIMSPRDSQSGLPTRQVWDDTDIVHVVSDAVVNDITYRDIEFDAEALPPKAHTGQHDTHELETVLLHSGDLQNDDDQYPDFIDVATPKLVRAAAADDFEEIAFAVADDPQAMDFTYQKIESFRGGDADFDGNGPATALTGDEHEIEYDL